MGLYRRAGAAPHVATEKLDDRYQLFFKGPTSGDIAAAKRRKEREAELATFVQTPVFQRLTTHPNAQRYDALIARYAKANEIDTALVKAIVAAESGYEPTAVSTKGALGLMQVIPETAARYGVDRGHEAHDRAEALRSRDEHRVGSTLPARLAALFENDVELALAAYNAGEGDRAALRASSIPPYPETQEYVKLVTQLHALYKPPPPSPPPPRA